MKWKQQWSDIGYGVRCGFEGWDVELGVLQWEGIKLLRRRGGVGVYCGWIRLYNSNFCICIRLFSDTSAMGMCVYKRFRFIEFGFVFFSLWHLFARRRICVSPLLSCEWYFPWRWRLKFKPKRRSNFGPRNGKIPQTEVTHYCSNTVNVGPILVRK